MYAAAASCAWRRAVDSRRRYWPRPALMSPSAHGAGRHARSARLRQRQFRCGVPADLEPVRARRAPGVERVPSRARARRHADGQLLQPGAVRRRT
ncbi:hypothetical protein G6F22_018443 [Rhizopus arrhizus]|nr:hypothetical protein G6F22_018443 [Rhizopus arrhizus]KAG1259933.1 hypothetical protein G6F66_014454 [Rhizopus arrhizus]